MAWQYWKEAVKHGSVGRRLCRVSGLEGGCAAWQGWREVQAGAWKYYEEIILNIIRQERKRNTEKIPWRKNLQTIYCCVCQEFQFTTPKCFYSRQDAQNSKSVGLEHTVPLHCCTLALDTHVIP